MALPAHVIAFFKSASTSAATTAIASEPVRTLATSAERRAASSSTVRGWSPLLLAPLQGTTAARPTDCAVGSVYFDTTLGKPVFLKTVPSVWVDSAGVAA